MKLLKFNIVKYALFLTIIHAIIQVVTMNALSLLLVDNMQSLFTNILYILFLYLAQSGFAGWSGVVKYESNFFLKLQFNKWIDESIQALDYETFMSKETGEYASLYVNDTPMVIALLNQRFYAIIHDAILVVMILGSLYMIHISIFLLGLVIVAVMYYMPRLYKTRLEQAILDSQEAKKDFVYYMTELLQKFSVFYENQTFHYFNRKSFQEGYNYASKIGEADCVGAKLTAFIDFMSSLFTLATLGVLSYLVMEGVVSSSNFLVIMALVPVLSASVASLVTSVAYYDSGKVLMEEKFSFPNKQYSSYYCKPLSMKTKMSYHEEERECIKKEFEDIQTLKTKDILVLYKEALSLKDITLHKGNKYALVGRSGCGKSTLLKVLLGLEKRYTGEVLVNDVAYHNHLLDYIGYVDQNILLLNTTLYENISLGRNVSRKEVEQLLIKVGLTQFSIDHMIEENGKNLSGGQKQRIALARVFLTNKNIIFLDEATANLDKEATLEVENLLLDMDITLVVISHHMNEETINKFDKIIEL